ncbi:hypothetical protein [Fundidesulfovibrio magnetotacticus]|uniref:hypothetical protein n=1 Tax=Fundidesulfovibrio magnetotacticus TaxID=2730080 RepID=UPI0015633C10|nr:hypothetical protein [Fundidesulfovibrio magnetotacticus]
MVAAWWVAAIAAEPVYYDPTIKNIISKDCSRCHSGPLRNLMDYSSVKAYADSGMLEAMLVGLMRQFAGADGPVILDWIAAGAPKAPPKPASGAVAAAATQVYYEPTIRDIIRKDCLRCHTGGTRDLRDWDSVRAYAQNGMLEAMVLGSMRRFANQDADIILQWLRNGAPENPPRAGRAAPAVAAATQPLPQGQGLAPAPPCPPGAGPGNAPGGGLGQGHGPGGGAGRHPGAAPVAPGQLTYEGTIQGLLAQDCMRCHLGPFRKMTTYEDVKMYVDNGLFEALVMPGGQMHRFAGPNTRIYLAWVRAGAPR